jgi:hypothetical protein
MAAQACGIWGHARIAIIPVETPGRISRKLRMIIAPSAAKITKDRRRSPAHRGMAYDRVALETDCRQLLEAMPAPLDNTEKWSLGRHRHESLRDLLHVAMRELRKHQEEERMSNRITSSSLLLSGWKNIIVNTKQFWSHPTLHPYYATFREAARIERQARVGVMNTAAEEKRG